MIRVVSREDDVLMIEMSGDVFVALYAAVMKGLDPAWDGKVPDEYLPAVEELRAFCDA